MTTVVSEIVVQAPAVQAYRAFTNATVLRQWLCDVATVDPRQNGRIYLWWSGDFYSSGHYLEVNEGESVKFRWYSNIDPSDSEVLVSFTESNAATQVKMAHTVPEGSQWEQISQGFKSHWDQSLENLKSVLESGIDLRIANRPMLGFFPGDFSPEQARSLGVPVTEGLRLEVVVEGMGIASAGLQKDDVIVSLDGKKIDGFNSLRNAITGKKGGDAVEVTYYRGPTHNTVTLQLSRRPMLQVPFDSAELAGQARLKYEAVLAEVEKCFAGVSDAQANARPSPGEWCALDILAHLLQTERIDQSVIVEFCDGFVRQADGFGPNNEAYIQATVAAYPTVASMLEALRASAHETINLVANLPESFVQDKGSFYQVGNMVLQIDLHYNPHLAQIKTALDAARQ
jgi:uncharacterized protein YndB with AHSA1/START domain